MCGIGNGGAEMGARKWGRGTGGAELGVTELGVTELGVSVRKFTSCREDTSQGTVVSGDA